MTPNDEAIARTNWILQESYKIACRIRGIKDWTNDFKTLEAKEAASREVEKYQLDIAKLVNASLNDIRSAEREEKFEKRMDEHDKIMDDKFNDKKGKDSDSDYKIDDRGTDDIGDP